MVRTKLRASQHVEEIPIEGDPSSTEEEMIAASVEGSSEVEATTEEITEEEETVASLTLKLTKEYSWGITQTQLHIECLIKEL